MEREITYEYTGYQDRQGIIYLNGIELTSWSYDKKQDKCISDVFRKDETKKFIYRNSGIGIYKCIVGMIERDEIITDKERIDYLTRTIYERYYNQDKTI